MSMIDGEKATEKNDSYLKSAVSVDSVPHSESFTQRERETNQGQYYEQIYEVF